LEIFDQEIVWVPSRMEFHSRFKDEPAWVVMDLDDWIHVWYLQDPVVYKETLEFLEALRWLQKRTTELLSPEQADAMRTIFGDAEVEVSQIRLAPLVGPDED
jgi:hypothetical protein